MDEKQMRTFIANIEGLKFVANAAEDKMLQGLKTDPERYSEQELRDVINGVLYGLRNAALGLEKQLIRTLTMKVSDQQAKKAEEDQ